VVARRISRFSAMGSLAQLFNQFEQTFDTLAYRFPFLEQAGKLLFELDLLGCLLFHTMSETRDVLFHGKAEFALAFEQFNGAQHAFFECLKIVGGHGHLGGVFCQC
jgi:hypothetical protein